MIRIADRRRRDADGEGRSGGDPDLYTKVLSGNDPDPYTKVRSGQDTDQDATQRRFVNLGESS